jgi:hypothetical protein
MAAYFPLVMGDTPSLWLNNLPVGSITSWADLSQAFTSNIQVTYNHPGNAFNLGRVTMKAGERLRDYTNRFFENRNTCVSVRDDQVVDSYKKVRDLKVVEKIHESGAMKVAPLVEVVNKLIDTEEALVNQFDHGGKQDVSTSGAARDSSSKFRKRPSEVLAADGRRPSTFNVEEFYAVLDSPCTFHEVGTHTVRECQQFKRAFCTPEDLKQPSRLRPLDIRGRKAESLANTQNSVVSIHNIARQVFDYSTQRVYLLRRSLGDFQLFGDALACHVARIPRRRR